MTWHDVLLALFLVSLYSSPAIGEGKQQEGEQLISQALQMSDIRAPGAQSFHLKVSFQNLGGGPLNTGTYTETWVSKEQWRREVEIGSFRRIEVGRQLTKWLLDSGEPVPPEALIIDGALNRRTLPGKIKVKQIESKDLNGKPARCVRLENEYQIEAYCVDEKNLLLSYEFLSRRMPKSHIAYVYGNYEKFGDRLYPRSVRYDREGDRSIQIRVLELEPETSVDSSMFAALRGGIELANCLTNEMKPPRADYTRDPEFPPGQRGNSALVVLSLIVGPDGLPSHIEVARSDGQAFDRAAVDAVRQWRFRPSTCHGTSVGAQINVEVSFRR
jgi:TonB family protein